MTKTSRSAWEAARQCVIPALSTWAGDPHSASPLFTCHTTTLQAQQNRHEENMQVIQTALCHYPSFQHMLYHHPASTTKQTWRKHTGDSNSSLPLSIISKMLYYHPACTTKQTWTKHTGDSNSSLPLSTICYITTLKVQQNMKKTYRWFKQLSTFPRDGPKEMKLVIWEVWR